MRLGSQKNIKELIVEKAMQLLIKIKNIFNNNNKFTNIKIDVVNIDKAHLYIIRIKTNNY